ncbi:MAG: histidine phosphatase family protein [Phycisphaerales bacterium]|nr:histidine phosphatase family protein [Phycisphaerales bacterium]
MPSRAQQIWLIRHAETAWSRDGRHTGRTDIELTAAGENEADRLAARVSGQSFALVLSSPLKRAMDTARRCGVGAAAQPENTLLEWDYGDFEGLTSAQIAQTHPHWDLWRDGCPHGETLAAVAARAEAVITRCIATQGNVLLFSHGHMSRMLAAMWLQLPPSRGRSFGTKAGSVNIFGWEHGNRVLWQWDSVATLEGH